MSGAVDRKARLLRLREVEHRLAVVRLAQAQAAHDTVDRVQRRVADVRAGLVSHAGRQTARDLHATTELAERLDAARRDLDRSAAQAAAVKRERQAEQAAGQVRVERTERAHCDARAARDRSARIGDIHEHSVSIQTQGRPVMTPALTPAMSSIFALLPPSLDGMAAQGTDFAVTLALLAPLVPSVPAAPGEAGAPTPDVPAPGKGRVPPVRATLQDTRPIAPVPIQHVAQFVDDALPVRGKDVGEVGVGAILEPANSVGQAVRAFVRKGAAAPPKPGPAPELDAVVPKSTPVTEEMGAARNNRLTMPSIPIVPQRAVSVPGPADAATPIDGVAQPSVAVMATPQPTSPGSRAGIAQHAPVPSVQPAAAVLPQTLVAMPKTPVVGEHSVADQPAPSAKRTDDGRTSKPVGDEPDGARGSAPLYDVPMRAVKAAARAEERPIVDTAQVPMRASQAATATEERPIAEKTPVPIEAPAAASLAAAMALLASPPRSDIRVHRDAASAFAGVQVIGDRNPVSPVRVSVATISAAADPANDIGEPSAQPAGAPGAFTVAASIQTEVTAPGAPIEIDLAQPMLDLHAGDVWLTELAHDIAAAADTGGRLRFTLMPEHLGRLDVDVMHTDNGLSVQLTARKDEAAAILTAAQPRLLDELRSSGARVAEASVLTSANDDPRRDGRSMVPHHQIEAAPSSADADAEPSTRPTRNGRYA